MSDEYIRKADAVDRMNRYGSIWMEYTEGMGKHEVAEQALKASKQAVIDVLENLPSADVVQIVHGRWMPQKGGGLCCSECGRYALDEPDGNFIHVSVPSKFCPHCGAKMNA